MEQILYNVCIFIAVHAFVGSCLATNTLMTITCTYLEANVIGKVARVCRPATTNKIVAINHYQAYYLGACNGTYNNRVHCVFDVGRSVIVLCAEEYIVIHGLFIWTMYNVVHCGLCTRLL